MNIGGASRTDNPIGHILPESGGVRRVVGAFPDGQSALNLAATRLRHFAGTAWSIKRRLKCRAAEGPADERCHSSLEPMPGAAQLKPKCERVRTLPNDNGPQAWLTTDVFMRISDRRRTRRTECAYGTAK